MPEPYEVQSETGAGAARAAVPLGRRRLLRGVGLGVLATGGGALLGACSGSEGAADPAATATSPAASSPAAPTSAATSTSPSPSASRTPSPQRSTTRPPSGPSVATDDVPVGGGTILDDEDYVVTQPSRGEFKAFSKICTHQGCPVSAVRGESIVCNCHGSRFSIEDGSVTEGPARRGLADSKVTVVGGRVYVTD